MLKHFTICLDILQHAKSSHNIYYNNLQYFTTCQVVLQCLLQQPAVFYNMLSHSTMLITMTYSVLQYTKSFYNAYPNNLQYLTIDYSVLQNLLQSPSKPHSHAAAERFYNMWGLYTQTMYHTSGKLYYNLGAQGCKQLISCCFAVFMFVLVQPFRLAVVERLPNVVHHTGGDSKVYEEAREVLCIRIMLLALLS